MRNTRPVTTLLAALALVFLLAPLASGEDAQTYGAGVDLGQSTPIAKILAAPDTYIGKTVRIEGGILDVCPKKGCWIEIGDTESHIQLKVDDDVIVFPADSKGRVADAQGIVEAIELTREKYLAWLAHRAEEKGEVFDAAKAELGEGPFRIIRIRGTGATID